METIQLVIQIIPLAWAAAVSPTTLSFFLIMMSTTDNPRLAGFSFYLGAIIIFLTTVLLGIMLGNTLTSSGHSDPYTIAAIDLFLGAILLLLGIRSLFSKVEHESAFLNHLKVESTADNFYKFSRYFIIGLLTFLINFSTAIFVLGAARQIGLAKAGLISDVVAIFVLGIITLIVIEIPLLFFLLFPKTGEKVIEPMNEWINKNSNYIVALFLIFIGIYIVFNGLSRLGVV